MTTAQEAFEVLYAGGDHVAQSFGSSAKKAALAEIVRAALGSMSRAPQPAPTEPGWYYGRHLPNMSIHPMRVVYRYDTLVVSDEPLTPVHLVTWFGPVPTIEERKP